MVDRREWTPSRVGCVSWGFQCTRSGSEVTLQQCGDEFRVRHGGRPFFLDWHLKNGRKYP